MKRSFAIAAVLGVMLGFAMPAHAKTARQKFQSLVAKVTQKFGSPAKRVCICLESGKDAIATSDITKAPIVAC